MDYVGAVVVNVVSVVSVVNVIVHAVYTSSFVLCALPAHCEYQMEITISIQCMTCTLVPQIDLLNMFRIRIFCRFLCKFE